MPQTIFCIAFIIFIIVGLFAGPKIRQRREHKKDMRLINEVFNDAMYEDIKDSIAEFFVTRGYTPSIEELHQTTKRLMSYKKKGFSDRVLFEKIISLIPDTFPSVKDFNKFMTINTANLIKKYIPIKYQNEMQVEASKYCNFTIEEMHEIISLQRSQIPTYDINLYRFNYEQCAYSILINALMTIIPINKAFSDDFRKEILQKILAGAEEEGYYLSDEYKNNN